MQRLHQVVTEGHTEEITVLIEGRCRPGRAR